MKAHYKPEKPKANVSLGSLYEVNQNLMLHELEMSLEIINGKVTELKRWFEERIDEQYFMLLCKERSDYTLFNFSHKTDVAELAAKDVIECMMNRGILLAVSLQPDGVWEIWIKSEDVASAYYLFPYKQGVIEY